MVYWKIAKAQNWHSEALKKTYRVLRWPGPLGFNSIKAILISNSHGNRRHNIFFLSFDMNIWKYENPFQKCRSHPVKLWLRLVVPTVWPACGWDVQVSERSWGHSVCGLKQISKYGIWPWRPSLPLYLLLNCSLPGPQCGGTYFPEYRLWIHRSPGTKIPEHLFMYLIYKRKKKKAFI